VSDILIVKGVSKLYQLHRNRSTTLKEAIIRRLAGRSENGFKAFWALRDVSFSMEQGRSLGIIGHNGAGKSTLLRLVCGLGRPTKGEIRRMGHMGSLLELGSGFNSEMTGRENLMTGGILSGLTKRQIRANQNEIIAFAEMEDFIDQPVRTYSTGMYLRLAFATAVHFDPDFLVIDEVLAVGDSRFKQKCVERMNALHASGKSLIIVSHDMEQIRAMCDEVIVMEEGRVEVQTDPETAIKCYNELLKRRSEKRAALIQPSGNTPSPAVKTHSRQGTQEAVIDSVRLFNAEGKTIETLLSGESLTVEIEYSVMRFLPDLALILEIRSDGNVKCIETFITSAKRELGEIAEKGIIQCHFPEMPLSGGLYHIDIGLFPTDWSFIYDYHWQMHSLNIVDAHGPIPNTRGVVRVRPNWTARPHD